MNLQKRGRMRSADFVPWFHVVPASLTAVALARIRWREALSLRDKMLADGCRADSYTFSALIEACSKAGQVGSSPLVLR